MTEQPKKDAPPEAEIADEVREAFDSAAGQARLREEVRRIALQALSRGQVDTAAIGSVISAVLDGAQAAVAQPDAAQRDKLKAALEGLDEALAVAAEAAHLAIREAAGHGEQFSRADLQRATETMSGIENQLLEGVSEAARRASASAAGVFDDFVRHARASGTAVGGRVNTAAQQLREVAGELTAAQIQAATQGLRVTGAMFASIAAGFFSALADRLESGGDDQSDRSRD